MVKANFNAYNSYITDSLYQWDLNQVLKVYGLNLETIPEVHFSNSNMGKAIVRQATIENHVVNVTIPNSLLQEPLRIFAHIGIYEGDTFKTVEMVEIPVIARKRPEDYTIEDTDEEIYSFKELENKIDNALVEVQGTEEEIQNKYNEILNKYNEILDSLDDSNKTTIVAGVMSASKWSGNTYSFEDIYPVANYNIEIALNNTATADQVDAFNEANIVGSATTNVVKAYGDKPTIDIPIIIKAVTVGQ